MTDTSDAIICFPVKAMIPDRTKSNFTNQRLWCNQLKYYWVYSITKGLRNCWTIEIHVDLKNWALTSVYEVKKRFSLARDSIFIIQDAVFPLYSTLLARVNEFRSDYDSKVCA
uniref:DDE Tnp4 domain-containing protein n=1 Tax=Trichogramma kaykai TaxID=54128 RepID=A0ABD2WUI5_9HYME